MTETSAPIDFEFERLAKEAARKTDAARSPAARHEPKPPKPTWRDHVFTAADLQNEKFKPQRAIVPGIVCEGINLLAGKPKIGKSWAALEIAIACATGSTCLGGITPTRGKVLYAACEDNKRRLQTRMRKLLGENVEWPKDLTLATQWERLDKKGAEHIEEWLSENPDAVLVILDTLASVKPIRTQQGYLDDYTALEPLHKIIKQTATACLVLHHQRKSEADDPLDTISGTLGLTGAADNAIVLRSGPQGTSLYVRGREMAQNDYAIRFDKVSCRWSIIGDAQEVQMSDIRKSILDVLYDKPNYLTPKEIATLCGHSAANVSVRLAQMVTAGQVWQEDRGHYWHAENHRRRTVKGGDKGPK